MTIKVVKHFSLLAAAIMLLSGCVAGQQSADKSRNNSSWDKYGTFSQMGPITQQDINAYIKFQTRRNEAGVDLESLKGHLFHFWNTVGSKLE